VPLSRKEMHMRRLLAALAFVLASGGTASAHGLLIPEEKSIPPLAMLNHKVTITVDDQVATTRVEQTFRNHTARPLEATYVFPVPKGASVNKFTMWVNGKETKGELVEADKARQIYTSIVRRTQDPGLLEYMGNDLLRMRVFPIPANGDQKVALTYTSVSAREKGLVEYVYPLKTDGKATATLEEFAITAVIKSQHGVQNVYSPTHAITLKRKGDKEVTVNFDKQQGLLDRDFQLFYQLGDKDVGLTALTHRPVAAEAGYFLMLITPKVELSKSQQVPRDVVLVLDTSGSMRGEKMEQARKALKYCLNNLSKGDRFGLVSFATTVNRYKDGLTEATPEQLDRARKWVDDLEANGGTAIYDALEKALELRPKEDEGRTFTMVFFTDGQPTIGDGDKTQPEAILKNTIAKNTANTRIFTFGVGDDVNATLLDQLAERTRALATYVRPHEDIEVKTSSLFAKMSHPVLANLRLATTGDVRLSEIYPPQLPDLFHGGQLTVAGRYTGKGPSAIKLTGRVGKDSKEFVYEISFPEKTSDKDGKDFVEHLWARRKVGYLLDQIRANGEKKELKDEVITLAKRYGITTPYTSYLIVPDSAVPIVNLAPPPPGTKPRPRPVPLRGGRVPEALKPAAPGGAPSSVTDFARKLQEKPGDLGGARGIYANSHLKGKGDGKSAGDKALKEAWEKKDAYEKAQEFLKRRDREAVQAGKLGVDLSIQMATLRSQTRLEQTAMRQVQGRQLMEIGGVWIDEGFTPKTPALVVKAQSDAYFKLLEKKPELKDVFRLGNHLVWLTPSGTALVIDLGKGQEKLSDKEIDKLFVKK
jgi:Ca-activated chloride channel homolog